MNKNDLISEWLEKAGQDYTAAAHMLYRVHPELTEISCYHSQQCVEKSPKAFLIYHDFEPPYTHDLAKLCLLCEEFEESFSSVANDCGGLTQYATRTRYPDETEITFDEAVSALRKAENIFKFVVNKIPGFGLNEASEKLSGMEGDETVLEL